METVPFPVRWGAEVAGAVGLAVAVAAGAEPDVGVAVCFGISLESEALSELYKELACAVSLAVKETVVK